MEEKRGTKRARSLSKEGSPSPDGAKTPPPAPSGSSPPLKSPPEVSSLYPCSPMWEQGGSSVKAPLVNLSSSSDEGDLIVDVSQDEVFARRLFGDLNHDFLGPPDDGKIIIISDFDEEEEEEVSEKKATNAEVMPSFVARSPAPTASADDSLKYFNALHASYNFCNILCFCYVFDVIHRLCGTVIGVLFNTNQ
jgi:hypothetical protein